jgi:hypothetical protein
LRLCHPLQDEEFNKQYLVVLEGNSKLKVFSIVTLKLIFQKDVFCQKSQFITIETDDLNEYLMMKTMNKASKKVENIDLLKVNKDYYYSPNIDFEAYSQSFFMFDIEVGIRNNLQLFPSHS